MPKLPPIKDTIQTLNRLTKQNAQRIHAIRVLLHRHGIRTRD